MHHVMVLFEILPRLKQENLLTIYMKIICIIIKIWQIFQIITISEEELQVILRDRCIVLLVKPKFDN